MSDNHNVLSINIAFGNKIATIVSNIISTKVKHLLGSFEFQSSPVYGIISSTNNTLEDQIFTKRHSICEREQYFLVISQTFENKKETTKMIINHLDGNIS